MDAHEDPDAAHITREDQDLACEMIRMLDNPARMKNYGEKAGERAEIYQPERYREDLKRIFEQILS